MAADSLAPGYQAEPAAALAAPPPRRRRRWWSVAAGLLAATALVWVALAIDVERLMVTLRTATPGWLLVLLLAVAGEQLVRAWKWRQIQYPLKRIPTLRLFGAIMAGYLANILVPLGMSPLVRAWIVARLENLKMSVVLATVAIDRFIDGVVFAAFVALVLAFAVFPDPDGNIRLGLVVAGSGTFALFAGLLAVLAWHKRRVQALSGRMLRLLERLPVAIGTRINTLALSFADGIVWPRETWRRIGVLLASIIIKIIATTHFFWAGLAFGVVLAPIEYVFLLVFAGFAHIIAHAARVPGGFILGSIFALGLLDVPEEEAAAMVLAVQIASMVTVATIGAVALWWHGITLGDLRRDHVAGARAG